MNYPCNKKRKRNTPNLSKHEKSKKVVVTMGEEEGKGAE